jgi:hypothetical protein
MQALHDVVQKGWVRYIGMSRYVLHVVWVKAYADPSAAGHTRYETVPFYGAIRQEGRPAAKRLLTIVAVPGYAE